jgi:alpha-ketoglutarate-dependent taurine dioxygenase
VSRNGVRPNPPNTLLSSDDRQRLKREGYVVIQGVNAEDLLPTAREIGRPYPDPRDRVLVKTIRPQPETLASTNTLSSRYGTGAFPLHTEAAYLPRPPRYFLLYCVSAGSGGRTTTLLDSTSLFALLSSPRRPGTWVVRAGRRPFLCNALSRTAFDDFRIRYDRECLFPAGPTSRAEERLILAFIAASRPATVLWAAKQLLIVDNGRILHGRGGSNTDDGDRHLMRVLVMEAAPNAMG